MLRAATLALGLMFMTGRMAAYAEEPPPTSSPGDQYGFRCMDKADLAAHEAGSLLVLVDHFSIRERNPLLKGDLKVVEVSYAVTNRTPDIIAEVDAGFLALDAAMVPVFVVTARPLSYLVQPGTTGAASGDIFVSTGSLAEVRVICVKVSVVLRSTAS